MGWIVVVPVKGAPAGKSRLGEVMDASGHPIPRSALARAVALDTIAAAAGAPGVERVLVVTADTEVAVGLESLAPPSHVSASVGLADLARVEHVAEVEPRGIDAAIAHALASIPLDAPRAALLGDLPALDPHELGDALARTAAHPRAVVADREGTGSTLVTAAPGVPWGSAFGEASFIRHLALGCTPLALPDESGLRSDVDTPDQLSALAGRLGPRTAALLGVRPGELAARLPG